MQNRSQDGLGFSLITNGKRVVDLQIILTSKSNSTACGVSKGNLKCLHISLSIDRNFDIVSNEGQKCKTILTFLNRKNCENLIPLLKLFDSCQIV